MPVGRGVIVVKTDLFDIVGERNYEAFVAVEEQMLCSKPIEEVVHQCLINTLTCGTMVMNNDKW